MYNLASTIPRRPISPLRPLLASTMSFHSSTVALSRRIERLTRSCPPTAIKLYLGLNLTALVGPDPAPSPCSTTVGFKSGILKVVQSGGFAECQFPPATSARVNWLCPGSGRRSHATTSPFADPDITQLESAVQQSSSPLIPRRGSTPLLLCASRSKPE